MTYPRIDMASLSAAEKILLAEELWQSARTDADNMPVSKEVEAELRRRLALSEAGEMEYYSWEEVKARLLGKLPSKE